MFFLVVFFEQKLQDCTLWHFEMWTKCLAVFLVNENALCRELGLWPDPEGVS